MITLGIILLVLSSAAITAFLAGQRHRDIMSWYVAGLLFGPLAWIVALLPIKRSASSVG